MEFIRENNMSRAIFNEKSSSIELGLSTLSLATWANADSYHVSSVMSVWTGNAHWQVNLDADKSQALIDLLHVHIANIKANELEILALQTKVAA
jgi:hypothetical protein